MSMKPKNLFLKTKTKTLCNSECSQRSDSWMRDGGALPILKNAINSQVTWIRCLYHLCHWK